MKLDHHPVDYVEEGDVSVNYGNQGNGTANAIVKWLAGLGAVLAAAAIGFAYGRIFDHESRISGLEAVEKYREQERHDKTVYRGATDDKS